MTEYGTRHGSGEQGEDAMTLACRTGRHPVCYRNGLAEGAEGTGDV